MTSMKETSVTTTTAPPEERVPAGARGLDLVPRHHPMWVVEALAVIAVLVWAINGILASGVVQPAVIVQFLVSSAILEAVWNTLVLATLALTLAFVVGTVVALCQVSRNPVISGIAHSYVYLFRGTPMLVQLLIWFNGIPVIFPRIVLGIPFTDIVFIDDVSANVITPFVAALLGLGLAESGYMAEIIRGGMLAVDRGQLDAARAIGMTELGTRYRIVLPQTFRLIVPATGNQYVSLLKGASLASVIGYFEIVRVTTDIYSANFRVMELLVVGAFWYLVLTGLATLLQQYIERRFPVR